MSSFWALGPFVAALFAVPYLYSEYRKRSQRKYFPGPPSEPILGHVRLFPQDLPWVKFAEWGKEYGQLHSDVLAHVRISLNLQGQSYISVWLENR